MNHAINIINELIYLESVYDEYFSDRYNNYRPYKNAEAFFNLHHYQVKSITAIKEDI